MDAYSSMNELDVSDSCSEDSESSAEDLAQITAKLTLREEAEEVEQAQVRRLSEKPAFQYGVGGVILLNTLVISLEAAYVQHNELKHLFASIEFLFTVVYVAEIAIRLSELGFHPFFCGSECGWNWFDFSVTATGVIDTVLTYVGFSGVGASAARLFRVLRILRLFRAFRFLSEIDYVIFTATRAMLKLALLVALVVFVSAIVTTNVLWDSLDEEVAGMYSNLGASMWTMFKLMTLENWIGAVERTASEKPGMLPFFVCFIFVASIAIMSLVPAIFIELNLTDREKTEKRRILKERADAYKSKARLLKYLFKVLDRDHNGSVSISEMSWFLQHSKNISDLQAAGVATEQDVRDARLGLFDFWESKLEEHDNRDADMKEEEFLSGALQSWGHINERTLWRSVTGSRKQLRELSILAKRQQAQLERQQTQLDLLVKMVSALGGTPARLSMPVAKGSASDRTSTTEGSCFADSPISLDGL